jgi:predicted metal-dependent enzyme (double-stranded beta helix superfamily)
MAKLLDKPLSLVAGVTGGILAGVLFRQVWKYIADEEEVPDPTDEHRRWGEVLTAAALQGAIYSVVKAATRRGSARAVRAIVRV